MKHKKFPERLLAHFRLVPLLTSITLFLGLLHAWVGRYSMNADGMSYLDVGASFFRHDWTNAVNAWWSPMYPWTVGVVLGLIKPPPRWEFPLVHAVNFAFFVIASAAFGLFLRALLALREKFCSANSHNLETVPDWPLVLIAYAIFWWVTLELETLYDVCPDLAAAACFFAMAAMLIRLQGTDELWKFALFGLSIGVGYWTKAVFFPLGFVILAVSYWWRRTEPKWRVGMAVSAVVFLCVSSPLIFLLSKQKGRLTFGDSGKGNYAWSMSPTTRRRNWQGREPQTGTPLHPTRELMEHPPVYEFDGPVLGTYPPWTDPSYWNDGLKGHFRLKSEIAILLTTIPSELRLLGRAQPGLVAGMIALALLGGYSWWMNLRRFWPLMAMSLVGMAAYLPLAENDRYLGGFLLVLFLLPAWAAQLPSRNKNAIVYISLGVFVSMSLGTADYTLRVLTKHYAIPGVGPNSTQQDVVAAEQLWQSGIRPGEKVAIIGDGTQAYWAHLAKVRIVAEIMEIKGGCREFWSSSPEVKEKVYRVLRQAHAVSVVSSCTTSPPEPSDGWQEIAGTPYHIRSLP